MWKAAVVVSSLIATSAIAWSAASVMPAPAGAPLAAPKAFGVDTVHSSAVFRIRHNGVSNFYGRFTGTTGSFAFDPADLSASSITCEIDLNTVDTGAQKRDDHLRSPDFFNVKQFPKATFESSGFEKNSDGSFTVTGMLSLHGESKEITARLEYGGTGKARGGEVAGIEATFEIKRADFGMTTYLAPDGSDSGGLGNTVKVIISLEGAAQ